MKNIIGYTSWILLILCIMTACDRNIPFDKSEWNTKTYDKDEVGTPAISKQRYGMTLWLKKHYIFCGKSIDEITEKFIENPTEEQKSIIREKKEIIYPIREENLTFLIGFAKWRETDWLEIYFDENNHVSKARIVHIDPYDEKRTEINICGE